MKELLLRQVVVALSMVPLFVVISCASVKGAEEIRVMESPGGAIIVDTMTTTATVTAKDEAERKLTLVFDGGAKTTYKAGPEVVNFDQIQVGDMVKATVTEEVAIYIGHGAPPNDVAEADVALAPVGAEPGGILVDTEQVTATVTAVDTNARKVSLAFPDGTTKEVKVGKQVDLSAVMPGDDVTVQVSEGVAIAVSQP